MPLTVATRVLRGTQGEDRALHRATDRGHLIVIADGAGGSGGGAFAADFVLHHAAPFTGDDFAALLTDLDRRLFALGNGAETTAVVLRAADTTIRGASIGDSSAWLIDDTIHDLTAHQVRKPLLGSGRARPTSFQAPRQGLLLVATDGLFNYTPRAHILTAATLPHPETIADTLIVAARLPSGALHDDIALIVAR